MKYTLQRRAFHCSMMSNYMHSTKYSHPLVKKLVKCSSFMDLAALARLLFTKHFAITCVQTVGLLYELLHLGLHLFFFWVVGLPISPF
jgi:hypothetical protein